jgi:hypothetical protein
MAAEGAIRFGQQRHKAVWFPKSSREMTSKPPTTSSWKAKIIFRCRLQTATQRLCLRNGLAFDHKKPAAYGLSFSWAVNCGCFA